MRRLLWSASLLATPLLLSACAHLAPGRAEGPQGTVVGVIALPQGVSPENACEHLQVFATDAQGERVGEPSITAGRNRCAYTLNYVEANVPVKLTVTGTAGVCGASPLTPRSLPGPFTLQERETKLVDLALTCAQ